MSKYKPLTEPITRREACLILERKRFDGAVRSGELQPVGKQSADGEVPIEDAAVTAPLLFDQAEVRQLAKAVADELKLEAKKFQADAKALAKAQPPLTRRQIATLFGKRLTGILIRSGQITPDGTLTDTQTAAHTYDPKAVAAVAGALAETRSAEYTVALTGAKTRVPA